VGRILHHIQKRLPKNSNPDDKKQTFTKHLLERLQRGGLQLLTDTVGAFVFWVI
jgi:hypothetical protein